MRLVLKYIQAWPGRTVRQETVRQYRCMGVGEVAGDGHLLGSIGVNSVVYSE